MFKKIILLLCPLFIIAHSYASELERKREMSQQQDPNEELKKMKEELEQVKYERALLKKAYDTTFSYSESQEKLIESLETEVKKLKGVKDALYTTNKKLLSLYEKKDEDLAFLQTQLREAKAAVIGGDWAIKGLSSALETRGFELKKTKRENKILAEIAAQAGTKVADLTDEANQVLGQVRKDELLFEEVLLKTVMLQDELRGIDGLPRKNKTASQSSLQSITEERIELPITNE